MSTYFLLDPFDNFYRIRVELIYVLSKVVCIPITFYPTLGHHQGRIYFIHGLFNGKAILVKEQQCPWCNGYRRRKWTRRREFKS